MRLTTVGRVARNSIALTAALMIKRSTHFVLYILIARYLGVEVFGQFSLAYSLFLIFEVPARFGLPNLMVREVAKKKDEFDKYLINGHLIVFLATLVCLGLWALLIHLMGYSPEVIKASYLFGLALIPMVMCKICESIFRAYERMQFIVYSFALANVFKLILAWILLWRGYGLYSIIVVIVVIQWLMWLLEWYFIYLFFARPSWRIDWTFGRNLVRGALTFLGVSIFTDLFIRMNIIILAKMRGEVSVGLYNAGFQITFLFMVISLSLASAVYPVLSRTYADNIVRFKQYAERSIELLLSLAFPLTICFFFLADSILLIFRPEFIEAAPILRALGFMLIPLSFDRILGGVLLASGHQRVNLIIVIVNSVGILIFSLTLISLYGTLGCGLALLAAMFVSFVQHYGYVSLKVIHISLPRVIWKPLLASLVLVGYFLLVRNRFVLPVLVPSALLVYGLVLFGVYLVMGKRAVPLRAVLTQKPGPGIEEYEDLTGQ
jgi:O-antigen/teichoic acid export membrane protein